MDLSVVVPTLDGREQLQRCLDSLATNAPEAELIVVNGPSTDGTSGMVRGRDDVDVLVEVADRNVNVARNAGISVATGDVIALVGYDLAVESGWYDAIQSQFDAGVDVATGPTRHTVAVGMTTESEESDEVAGRRVTYFNGDNVAFSREAIEAIDGFDESLETGGARDGSHRLAGLGHDVVWNGEIAVTREVGTDGGTPKRDWTERSHSFAYRLTKSYGPRPRIGWRLAGRTAKEWGSSARDVIAGTLELSEWATRVQSMAVGVVAGARDGLVARYRRRSPDRNPNGLSSRYDRAVEVYDRR